MNIFGVPEAQVSDVLRSIEVKEGRTLLDYWMAPGNGPLNPEWRDKPHRLLYDLIGEIVRLRRTTDTPA